MVQPSLNVLPLFQLTDDEVREGEELKRKLQKKHKKTVKKVGLSFWVSKIFVLFKKQVTLKRQKRHFVSGDLFHH